MLEADGAVVASSSEVVLSKDGKLYCKMLVPADVKANNSCVLKLKLKSMDGNAAGSVACDM